MIRWTSVCRDKTEREAWKACRDAMAEYEKGRAVTLLAARSVTPCRSG